MELLPDHFGFSLFGAGTRSLNRWYTSPSKATLFNSWNTLLVFGVLSVGLDQFLLNVENPYYIVLDILASMGDPGQGASS